MLDGWCCLFACFLEEDLEEGFEGKKGEIVRFGNSMKTLRFCLREIVFEWQKLWVVEIKSFFASSRMS